MVSTSDSFIRSSGIQRLLRSHWRKIDSRKVQGPEIVPHTRLKLSPSELHYQVLWYVAKFVFTGERPTERWPFKMFDENHDDFGSWAEELHTYFKYRAVAAREIRAQFLLIKDSIFEIDSTENGPAPNRHKFNWLMNLFVVFRASTTENIQRALWISKFLLVPETCEYLNQCFGYDATVPMVGNILLQWSTILSQASDEPQDTAPAGATKIAKPMHNCLSVYASPLHPSVRNKLAVEYVRYHDSTLQFYPPRT